MSVGPTLLFVENQSGKKSRCFIFEKLTNYVGEQILYKIAPENYEAWEAFGKRKVPYLLDWKANRHQERWPEAGKPLRWLRFFPILHGIDVVSPPLFSPVPPQPLTDASSPTKTDRQL